MNLVQSYIGYVSPEIFNSFPRSQSSNALTALDTIITGFESVYSYRSISNLSQSNHLKNLLQSINHPKLLTSKFLNLPFAQLSIGQQSLMLILRALIKEPELIILDEPFLGLDELSLNLVLNYLNFNLKPHQALIIVSHQDQELPICINQTFQL